MKICSYFLLAAFFFVFFFLVAILVSSFLEIHWLAVFYNITRAPLCKKNLIYFALIRGQIIDRLLK